MKYLGIRTNSVDLEPFLTLFGPIRIRNISIPVRADAVEDDLCLAGHSNQGFRIAAVAQDNRDLKNREKNEGIKKYKLLHL